MVDVVGDILDELNLVDGDLAVSAVNCTVHHRGVDVVGVEVFNRSRHKCERVGVERGQVSLTQARAQHQSAVG